MTGDNTKAEALRIAHSRLLLAGWKFSAEDIGKFAAKIINAMNADLENDK